jgi:hypothetical protein
MNSAVTFAETQRFLRHWWALLLAPFMMSLVPVIIQLASDKALVSGPVWLAPVLVAMLPLLFHLLRLEVRLDAAGVHYRLVPFHLAWRHLPWADVSQAYVRSYDPLGEYGGWGLKGSRRNRALNMAGDEGIQLVLPDGRRLLLGTQRSAEAQQALAALGQLSPPQPA